MARHEPRPSQVPAHPYLRDPAVPPDAEGRAYCARCGLPGAPGDDRHPLPDPTVQGEHRRRAGDRTEPDQPTDVRSNNR